MLIVLGILAGLLGFLPIFLSMRIARRFDAATALGLGLYGVGGTCVSLIVLVAATIACGLMARDQIIGFAIAEVVTFLALTIAYVLYKNVFAKKRKRAE